MGVIHTSVSYLRAPLVVSSGIATLLISVLYFKQNALIYPSHVPNDARNEIPLPSNFGLNDFEDLKIVTPDGQQLSAFYIRAPQGIRFNKNIIMLMFHGNAGNIGHRIPIAKMFVRMGISAFMLEYRGYGLSTGSPHELGLMTDAQTALNYLRERTDTKDLNIVVYGQSLGGAVSIQLVANNQDDSRLVGLVLENTFLSMRKLIPSVLPPARYFSILCHQTWSSESFLPSITKIPILFLSGLRDEIVPPAHMRRLFEICRSATKVWKPLPEGDHNSSVLEPGYFDCIEDFIVNLSGRKIEN